MKYILSIILFSLSSVLFAQNKNATVHGKVTDENGKPVSFSTVAYSNNMVLTNEKGFYSIDIPANDSITLYFSNIGFSQIEKLFFLTPNQSVTFNPIFQKTAIQIPKVLIGYNKEQEEDVVYLSSEKTTSLAGLSLSGIEGSLKTLPGVSSKSELSSQYSVRGGSYDENLVFINDIPVTKPNIAKSDQQEGLSIINPYMVGNLEFSSGGFGAQYGDKMSSVLNVNYKEVTEEQIEFDASLLDANLTLQGAPDSSGFSYLIGGRYKNTSLLLDSLDTKGDYKPVFYDVQSLLRYKINSKFKIAYWLYGANNTYSLAPDSATTDFGGLDKQFRMNIYFEGNEKYIYRNLGNALSFYFTPSQKTSYDFNILYYNSLEKDNFDILGQYRLSEVFKGQEIKQSTNDSTSLYAVGSYLEHGRNSLITNNVHISHNGKKLLLNFVTITWGASYSINFYDGIYNEWKFIDSANYVLPYNDTSIVLQNLKNAQISHIQQIGTVYLQGAKRFDFENPKRTSLKLNIGLRSTYDDYTKEVLLNPRFRILCKPSVNNNLAISFATGIYYQPPQYKELIDNNGTFYTNLHAQKSTHFVLGISKGISFWNRPFVFQTEAYFKKLHNLIPYTIQNVSTVYYPNLLADGYTTGIETKLNGEFVPGVESWISLSCMRSREHLINGASDEIRRPNDQLVNFGLFFQDYLPDSDILKMNLTYLFGTDIPTATPNASYNEFDNYKISSYSRIDIGLLMVLIGRPSKPTKGLIKNLTLGAEVFNLFDYPNKISYFWIEDVNGNYNGVPNYLTSRRLNVKLSLKI